MCKNDANRNVSSIHITSVDRNELNSLRKLTEHNFPETENVNIVLTTKLVNI